MADGGAIRRRTLRFARASGGGAALEFAMLSVPFFFLVCVIIELGLTLATQVTLDNAVNVAARQVELGNVTTSAGFKSSVCALVPTFVSSCSTKLQVYGGAGATFSTIVKPVVVGSTMAPTTFSSGAAGSNVLIEVLYPRTLLFNMVTSFSGVSVTNIVSAVAVRNEPYS